MGTIAAGGFVGRGVMGLLVPIECVMAGRVLLLLLLLYVVVAHSRIDLRISVAEVRRRSVVDESRVRMRSTLVESGPLPRNESHGCPIDHLGNGQFRLGEGGL